MRTPQKNFFVRLVSEVFPEASLIQRATFSRFLCMLLRKEYYGI